MMKRSVFPVLVGAGLSLAAAQASRADLVIYYNFNNLTNGTTGNLSENQIVQNAGTLGTAPSMFHTGTDAGGFGQVVPSGIPGNNGGQALRLRPAGDGSQLTGAPYVETNISGISAGVTPGSPYTAMAWVNFDNETGDNMIFGQSFSGNTLHNGTRNGNLHSGHWGDDIGPDQGITIKPGTGAWHHVAYTNDTAGTQQIYLDGNLVASGATGTGGGMDSGQTLAIGTANNGGSFSGLLDEVRVYNTLLTGTQIQQAMNATVPEPTTAAVLALGAAGLAMSRRRRAR